MCQLCVEINRERMTAREVVRALKEFKIPLDHIKELFDTIEHQFEREEFIKAVKDNDESSKASI